MAKSDDQGGTLDRTDTLAPAAMLAGKYKLGRLLGEGGMGAVYEAEHTGLGATVAVKLLGEGSNADPKSVARFKREAKAMGQIKHDNVVRVMDTGVDEVGLPYLVMELLDGESLSAVLRRERVLSPSIAVEIACQILAGLSVAHEKGVVHRDLKPGNVFIASQQDGSKRVKILDFGISKLHDSSTHNVTAEGALVGTPNFMAPEQITGESDSDIRIDVYAVGVLLYRMLTGRLPYVAKQADELYKKILAAKPTRPRDLQAEIPADLEAVVLRAMAPDRAKRFEDARTFERALRELYPTQEMFGSIAGGLHRLATLPRSAPSSEAPTVAAKASARKERQVDLHGMARFRPWIIAAAIVALVVVGAAIFDRARSDGAASAPSGPKLRFGISKYLPEEMVGQALGPLVEYLGEELGRPVELVVLDDYEGLSEKLVAGDLDMAALSAATYVQAKERDPQIRPFASPVRKGGNTDYQGYILVRSNSEIHKLEDLRGKVFCYVNPTSTSGYFYPRALFRASGIDPDTAFSATRFGGDHLQTLTALHRGACDGAAVYATIWHDGAKDGMPPQSFRPIATTDRIPDDAYVLSRTLDDELADRLEKALLALEPGGQLANRVLVVPQTSAKQDIIGFTPTSDADYASVRRFLAEEAAGSKKPAGDGEPVEPAE